MALRILFLDMNSFFASAEQYLRPELRKRPVVVVAVDVDSTCCIAASIEAKKLGIRTGTPVWEARKHKALKVVEARPEEYVKLHHRIIQTVEICVPVQAVHSIDEFSCRLNPDEAEPPAAIKLATRIKQVMRDQFGQDLLRCSIGLAPNRLLAKMAADAQKPNGLVVVTERDLPRWLNDFALDDVPGIGRKMLKRLHSAGVGDMAQLQQQTESQMRKIWSGIVGERYWHWLRGHDLGDAPTHRSTVGHSHVLPPELRTEAGAQAVLIRMIHKVGVRLRRINCWAGRMEIYISFTYREEGWSGSAALGQCQDTQSMIEAFNALWPHRPRFTRPTQVAVTLYDLVAHSSASPPLFPGEQRRLDLAKTLDRVNNRFGADTLYFAGMFGQKHAAPTRIAFNQIPEFR